MMENTNGLVYKIQCLIRF